MHTVFVDQICLIALLRSMLLGRSIATIWHFDPLGAYQRGLVRVFRGLRLIRAEVRQFEHNLGQVRDEAGHGRAYDLHRSARPICESIIEQEAKSNPLVELMSSEWATQKLLLYIDKAIEGEIRRECIRIGLVDWAMRTQLRVDPKRCALLIERTRWFPYLERHAISQGTQLLGYGSLLGLRAMPNKLPWLRRAWRKGLATFLRMARAQLRQGLRTRNSADALAAASRGGSPASTLGIHYYFRKLSFDPTERSEFFWLSGATNPGQPILLYDYLDEKPPDDETLAQLKAHGIRVSGRAPGIPTWVPTRRMYKLFVRLALKLSAGALDSILRGRGFSFFYMRQLLKLAREFAYWRDFYAANNVRVNVAAVNSSVSQVLALDSLSSVSVGFQYSISTLFPTPEIVSGETVQFVFSPFYERFRREIQPAPEWLLHSGFIYDSAIPAIQASGRAGAARRELQACGANFILCFFDESPVDHWRSTYWDRDLVEEYEYLLKWVLSDPTLGIIFKPKRPIGLFERLSPVSSLVQELRQAGRCKFLTTDTRVGTIFPAEAALMADVTIGMLYAGTASLESRLAGVPSVLIDNLGLRSHPFQDWGRDGVIFDDWGSLRAGVERYRAEPELYPLFGDWSSGLETIDPFRDGQANVRIGQYVDWVHQALQEGRSKADALALAAELYAQRWGKEHVVASGGEPDFARATDGMHERKQAHQTRCY